MKPPPIPTCWRCGSRQTRPWLSLTYFCQNCANRRITRRIADQQAAQFKWERRQALMQRRALARQDTCEIPHTRSLSENTTSELEPSTGMIESAIASLTGIFVIVIMASAIFGIAFAIWQRIIHPLITFLSFGFF